MSAALSARDADRARRVLTQLTAAQPARPEAARLLARLTPAEVHDP
jgi:hypothetical protein